MKKKITIALVMIFAVLAYITCASQILDANAEGMSVIMGFKNILPLLYTYLDAILFHLIHEGTFGKSFQFVPRSKNFFQFSTTSSSVTASRTSPSL